MSDVRVRLHLGSYQLEYRGAGTFFDRVVDPLLAAAARGTPPRGSAAPPVPATSGGAAPTPLPADPADVEADAPEAEGVGVPEPGVPSGFRPDGASFGHFIRQLGPETAQPDRQVVAFAFFLWNYEKKDEVTEEEIAGCFLALGLPVPEDLSGLCRQVAEGKRFLDASAEPGRWRLTEKGRNYVKTRLFAS